MTKINKNIILVFKAPFAVIYVSAHNINFILIELPI